MQKWPFFVVFFVSSVLQTLSARADIFHAERASLEFLTFVRVEVAARIVEAADPSIVGDPAPWIQSLSYRGAIEVPFSSQSPSENELRSKVTSAICSTSHDLELSPMREGGVKGLRRLRQRLRPSLVTVFGTKMEPSGSTPFSLLAVCPR